MNIISTAIEGLQIIKSTPYTDVRGAFARFYCEQELSILIGGRRIVQINHSYNSKVGTVRGLHFQFPPHAEMKMVRCIKGRVWDVAVDIRKGSESFLNWHAEELTSANGKMMVIPEGFAHGFQVLEPGSELLYLHTVFYNPEAEGSLRYNDPSIGISWPLAVKDLSSRDKQNPLINQDFVGISV